MSKSKKDEKDEQFGLFTPMPETVGLDADPLVVDPIEEDHSLMVTDEPVQAIDYGAPPTTPEGDRKPKDWEPSYVHALVKGFTGVDIEPDVEGWVITVSFDNEEDARNFYNSFQDKV